MESSHQLPSSQSTRVSSLDLAVDTKVDIEEELSAATSTPRKFISFTSIGQTLKTWFPRAYNKVTAALIYIRGPRPKVDLPHPTPLFDRSYAFRGSTVTLTVESAILRLTHPFASGSPFAVFIVIFFISSVILVRSQWYLTPASAFVDCTSALWSENAACGLNGTLCAPFTNYSFNFRCLAQCSSAVLQNPRLIGNTEVDFVPLLVGGGDSQQTYRADSFICASAIQTGIIKDSSGGCGTVHLVGNFTDYLPTTMLGLTSVSFPSSFPKSYRLTAGNSSGNCTDLRSIALAVNIIVTCVLFAVFRPKAVVMYWSLVCIGFWHVALFSQTQGTPPRLDVAFGAFLPALFVCYGFWRVAFRYTMHIFTRAPLEGMILYLASYWAGVLTNITTAHIPIYRLTASDIMQQPGGLTALIIIVLIVLVFVLNQVRVIRKTGWLPVYLAWYVAGGLVALAMTLLSGLQFRLHHYIISMVLLPGTGFPTRLSAIYQGFLLGMFLNGVAAFGFDSILQTMADLVGDAAAGSPLPELLTNSTTYDATIPLVNQTIFWADIPDFVAAGGWSGFSLLVDDVERYTGSALNYSLAELDAGLPHFFRLAYRNRNSVGDFTMTATLWPNGTWVDPLPEYL